MYKVSKNVVILAGRMAASPRALDSSRDMGLKGDFAAVLYRSPTSKKAVDTGLNSSQTARKRPLR